MGLELLLMAGILEFFTCEMMTLAFYLMGLALE